MIDRLLINFRYDQAVKVTGTKSFGQKQTTLNRAEPKPDESSWHWSNPFHGLASQGQNLPRPHLGVERIGKPLIATRRKKLPQTRHKIRF